MDVQGLESQPVFDGAPQAMVSFFVDVSRQEFLRFPLRSPLGGNNILIHPTQQRDRIRQCHLMAW